MAAETFFEKYFKEPSGEAKFCDSYVVFADLLGYKELILGTSDSDVAGLLKTITSALEAAGVHIESKGEDWSPSVSRYFSDCVSIVTPVKDYDDEYFESSFGFTIPGLMWWQMLMVHGGFPVRGGVDFGPVFLDDRCIFGKAHLEAYRLESKVAIYPRIAVSDAVLKQVKGQLGYYSKNARTPHEDEILIDKDGVAFLNYLAATYEDETFAEELLGGHAKLIADRLEKCPSAVRDKYEWMAAYHNWFCEASTGFDFDVRSLKVDMPSFELVNVRQVLEGAQ